METPDLVRSLLHMGPMFVGWICHRDLSILGSLHIEDSSDTAYSRPKDYRNHFFLVELVFSLPIFLVHGVSGLIYLGHIQILLLQYLSQLLYSEEMLYYRA